MTTSRRRECVPEMSPGELAIMITQQGTTTTVTLRGEWDMAEAPTVRQALRDVLERSPECLVLDLSWLSFIDSTGVHGVIELHRRSERQRVRLMIVPGPRAVQRVFELVGLSKILPFLSPGPGSEPRDPSADAAAATGSGSSLSRRR